ncbi:hypothetical protein GCM10010331_79020 [Streptomyces xanthochromogenes]|nr:hypothetical protein GCM10010331_79020 [Streptomyces xanthochromogenes]
MLCREDVERQRLLPVVGDLHDSPHAEKAIEAFAKTYGAKWPKALQLAEKCLLNAAYSRQGDVIFRDRVE